ncbi:hypothetical protein ACJHWK_23520, partial [Escherichia sp. WS547]
MREKTRTLTVRLPVSLIERIEQRAEKNKVTRTDAVIEALVAGLGTKPEGMDTKLLTAIEALRSEVRALAGGGKDARQSAPQTARQSAPQNARQIVPRGADPRFQAVSDEADQLIVSMTGENA